MQVINSRKRKEISGVVTKVEVFFKKTGQCLHCITFYGNNTRGREEFCLRRRVSMLHQRGESSVSHVDDRRDYITI